MEEVVEDIWVMSSTWSHRQLHQPKRKLVDVQHMVSSIACGAWTYSRLICQDRASSKFLQFQKCCRTACQVAKQKPYKVA